jgi:hypothetical protein
MLKLTSAFGFKIGTSQMVTEVGLRRLWHQRDRIWNTVEQLARLASKEVVAIGLVDQVSKVVEAVSLTRSIQH